MLSSTNPTVAGSKVQQIAWNGQVEEVKAGSWIVGLDRTNNKAANISAIVQNTLDQASATGVAVTLDHVLVGGGAIEVLAPDTASYEQVLTKVVGLPGFKYLEPNLVIRANLTPNDTRFSELYGMHNTGQTGGTADADIDAPEAWDVTTGNSSVVVGVIDTGVDYTHPDLMNNMWTNPGETAGNNVDDDGNGFVDDVHGWDFANDDADPMDDNQHGTHVAGTIGAQGNNNLGVVGVTHDVSIMALKFLDGGGSGTLVDAVDAINYSTLMKGRGVNIRLTNNSWGGGGFTQSLFDAIQANGNAGLLFIAAAGNSGQDNDVTPSYPSGYNLDSIIAVAATDDNDALASFSQFGATTVDLAAPGVDTLSTVPGGGYGLLSGTSMATPHVTGAAALALSIAPAASAVQLKASLLAGVDLKGSLTGKVLTGGRLNVANTVALLSANGPFVINSSPTGNTGGPVSHIDFTFSESMNTGSFSAASDIASFTGPGGANLLPQVTGFAWTGNTLRVNFTGQTANGSYSMTIGPNILATDGDAMNQDHDGTLGEAVADRYTGGFNIVPIIQYVASDVAFQAIDLEPGQPGVVTLLDGFDDSAAAIDIGSNVFNYYGVNYTGANLFASTNGLITLGAGNSSFTNTDLSSSPSEPAIAPFWDDLLTDLDTADQVLWKLETNRLIVEWSQTRHIDSGATSPFTFQAIVELNTGGRVGDIIFNYVDTDAGAVGLSHGASATVGIKPGASDSSPEVLVSFNTGTNPLIGNSQAIKLAPGATNQAPVIGAFDGAVTYVANATPVILDADATVTDADSANLATGVLTVALISNGQSTDALGIRNQGTGAGQIGVSGTNVTYGGTIIGTFAGGAGTTPLTVTLNASATPVAAQALLRNITFRNTSATPPTVARTVRVRLTDGDAGTSNQPTKTINVTLGNAAPVLSAIETAALIYLENEAPKAVTSTVVVTDADNANMTSARVAISVGYVNGQDVLSFTNANGITGAWDAATGSLNLTGNATKANYQLALRSVKYHNTSNTPNTATRTIRMFVNDGTINSNIASRNITVVSLTEPPAITGVETTPLAYTENAAPVSVTSTAVISDPDSSVLGGARIKINTNYQAGFDFLSFANTSSITGAWDPVSGTMVLSGISTVANYQAALRNVKFRNTSNTPVTAPRTVLMLVNDGTTNSPVVSRNINVSAANDGPILTGIESAALAYSENVPATNITGTIVVSDPDSASIASATVRVATNYANGQDVLSFTNALGITGAWNAATGTLTLSGVTTLANYQAALRTVKYVNTSNNPSTAQRTVSFQVNDGSANSNVTSRNITVAAVNDGPVLANIDPLPLTFVEGSAATQIASTLTVTDPDNSSLTGAVVRIGSNYVNGQDVLTFSAVAGITGTWDAATGTLTFTGNASVASYQSVLRTVRYRNTSTTPSTLTRSILIQVTDGVSFSNVAGRNVNVVPV